MSLLRAGLWLSAGIALGRLAGFIREAILARRFGLGPDADVAVLVLTLPDSLLNILIGAAMGAALVPALALRRTTGGQFVVDRLHAQIAGLSLVIGAILAALLAFAAEPLVRILAPGLSAEQVARAASLVDIALWAIPLTALSSVIGAGLQERERFASTALGTLWFNAAIITGLLVWSGTLAAIAWAMLAGAAIRVAGQALEWRMAGGGWRWGPWEPDRAMAIAYAQMLAAGAALVLLPLAGRWFASFAESGSIAAYTYATKLFELPLQVLVTVFATALFPRFTRLLAAGDEAGARRFLTLGSQVVLVAATTAAIAGAWFAHDLVRLAFRIEDPRVGDCCQALLVGLPLAGLTALLQAWCAARRDTRTPLIASALGVGLFFIAGWPVLQTWGLVGLAWLATGQQALVCLLLLRRQRPDCPPWPVAAAATAALAVCALSPWVEGPILRFALACTAGLVGCAAGLLAVRGLGELRR